MEATVNKLVAVGRPKVWGLLVMLAFSLTAMFLVTPVRAAGPEEDLARINTSIEKALTAAKAGDVALSQKEFKAFGDAWFEVEDGVRTKSKETYRNIELKMRDVSDALAKQPADPKAVVTALEALNLTNQAFIQPGTSQSATTAPTDSKVETSAVTIPILLGKLDEARDFMAKQNYAQAAVEVKEFQEGWLDVEGQVKTRSVEAYNQTENDMALAYTLLTKNSPEAKAVIDRMYTRLEPYKNTSSYGVFDAMIILLREGLEALLVVVALLTFLKKSGNGNKQPWIWGGAVAGLAVSLVLAVAIQFLFTNAINASNRELIEGITGLFAAVMLLYVSYWMHSKASAGAWQRYVKQKSTAALAKGSLLGLGLLSFLAIFREGAETALFYLGIGPSISTGDLLLGLGIGTLILLVAGVLLVFVGLRIPMGPFFTIASLLVFFLCFKFVGMGVHALQVGKFLPSSSANYLPENGFLGMFPTWETTIAQAVLLLFGIGMLMYSRLRTPRPETETKTANLIPNSR